MRAIALGKSISEALAVVEPEPVAEPVASTFATGIISLKVTRQQIEVTAFSHTQPTYIASGFQDIEIEMYYDANIHGWAEGQFLDVDVVHHRTHYRGRVVIQGLEVSAHVESAVTVTVKGQSSDFQVTPV